MHVHSHRTHAPSGTGAVSSLRNHSLLREGSRGAEVTDLQRKLKSAGFNPGPVDGIFGPKTEAALRSYQRAKGLQVDGVAGQQVWGSFAGVRLPPGSSRLGHDTRDVFEPGRVNGPSGNSNAEKLQWAMRTAREMGLTITSTTGGRHTPGSYHYRGRAIDVAGSPAQMGRFYDVMRRANPTELFYDPRGGIKNGQSIGAIGGHGDHVHVAF